MSSAFNLYPTLTEAQVLSVVPSSSKVELLYHDNGEEQYLSLENKTDNRFSYSAELRDPKCDWYPETHDLVLRSSINIADPSSWFGKNGVVSEDAIIGVALQWVSVKSEIRGIIPMGEFQKGESSIDLFAEHTFPKSNIKGSILLKTVIYLKASGQVLTGEEFLCNQTGTILGEIDSGEIFIDGNGSVFPIATINDPRLPLWTVYFDDTADPMQDSFDHEHVEIRLNRAHPCYEQLKIESSLKESPLFLEVITSALMIIIESAKELLGSDWDNVVGGQSNPEHGSIAEAVSYFVVKLGWDISSPAKLANSIHSFFDTNLQGGVL